MRSVIHSERYSGNNFREQNQFNPSDLEGDSAIAPNEGTAYGGAGFSPTTSFYCNSHRSPSKKSASDYLGWHYNTQYTTTRYDQVSFSWWAQSDDDPHFSTTETRGFSPTTNDIRVYLRSPYKIDYVDQYTNYNWSSSVFITILGNGNIFIMWAGTMNNDEYYARCFSPVYAL